MTGFEWVQSLSVPGAVLSVAGIGWYYLCKMETRIREDARIAHENIGKNISELRTDIREVRSELRTDIREVRRDIKEMRGDITGLSRSVGRIEGHLFKTVD